MRKSTKSTTKPAPASKGAAKKAPQALTVKLAVGSPEAKAWAKHAGHGERRVSTCPFCGDVSDLKRELKPEKAKRRFL